MSNIIGSSKPAVTETNAQPLSGYPSVDDAREAVKYGFGYGTGNEPFIEGKRARIMGQTSSSGDFTARSAQGMSTEEAPKAANDERQSRMLDLGRMSNWDVRQKLGPVFARAALAANRNPIAALGFDPNRSVMDVMMKNATVGGVYEPTADAIYANMSGTDPSSILHESIHRGIEKLRKNPEAAEILKRLPSEEYVVRWMMKTFAGDPEKGIGSISDKQRQTAVDMFGNDNGWGPDYRVRLAKLMEIAANMRKEQRPGGPR